MCRESHPSTRSRRRRPSTERRESCHSTERRGRQPSTAGRRSGVPSTHGGRGVFDLGGNRKFMLRYPSGRRVLDIGKIGEVMLQSPSGRKELMRRHQRVGEHRISAKRGEHQLTLNKRKVRQMCGYPGMTMKMYGPQRRDGTLEMKEHMYGSQSKLEHMYGFRRRQVRRPRRSHAVANLDLVRVRRTESQQEINESKKRVIDWHPPQSRAKLQRPRRLQRAMRGACHAVSHSIEKFVVFLMYRDDTT